MPFGASGRQGQPSQGGMVATESPMAAQNACPNESSAQAMQLAGSPEHVAEDSDAPECCAIKMGNTGVKLDAIALRRRGTGAWYAGNLSSIETPEEGLREPSRCSKWSILKDIWLTIVLLMAVSCNAISLQKQLASKPQNAHAAAAKVQSVSSWPAIGFRFRWRSAVPIWGEDCDVKLVSSVGGDPKEAAWKLPSELWLDSGDEAVGGEAYDANEPACLEPLILFAG